jgi:hypothetical protein
MGKVMAKRKYSMTKRKKIQPVPLKLNYNIPAGTNTSYVDLWKDASMLARKFLRQGQIAAIGNIRVTMPAASTPTAGNAVYISTIQQSWSASNAWHKAFALWNKMNREAMEEADSIRPKFYDFKIYMDDNHRTTGNLSPVNLGPFGSGPFPTAVVTTASPIAGEWDYSEIVIPASDSSGVADYFLHMHGPSTSESKGLIEGYQNSRSAPQSPDPVVTPDLSLNWMSAVFNEGTLQTNAVLNDLEDQNDELPYDQLAYPGGDTNYIYPENKAWCLNRSTVGVSTFNLGGMVAPCGLLRIDQLFSDDAGEDLIIEIELLPGEARGYHAVTMKDM